MALKKLHVGCGKNIFPGFINLDAVALPGVDVVHNLDKFPYPFKNEEFDVIEAHQVLEHVKDLPRTMQELARILKKGGKFKLDVPHFSSSSAYKDITHKSFFAYMSFNYFVKKHYGGHSYDYGYGYFSKIKTRLGFHKGLMIYNYIAEPLLNLLCRVYEADLYENTFLVSFFPAHKIEVVLIK